MLIYIVSVVLAFLILFLAAILCASRRENAVNAYFMLFLVCVSAWLLCGLVDRAMVSPESLFLTIQYRIAYAIAAQATGFFFLFAWGFRHDRKPGKKVVSLILAISTAMSLACLTSSFIRNAEIRDGQYYVANGPLYLVFVLLFFLLGIASFYLIYLKYHESRSIDRSRALYILLGFGIFFVLTLIFTIVIPIITGRDVTSDYSFLSIIIPILMTSYAILRYQLLDIRLALRRGLAYVVTLTVFSIPLIAVFSIIRSMPAVQPFTEEILVIVFLAVTIALSPAILDLAGKMAARLLFTGLYDENELINQASNVLLESNDIARGIQEATSLICKRLRLKELVVVIPQDIFSGAGDWLIGSRFDGGIFINVNELFASFLPAGIECDLPLIRGDLMSARETIEAKVDISRSLEKLGAVACLPVKGGLENVGLLLVGEKLEGSALEPIDVSLLTKLAKCSGTYIENYLLTNYLMIQLEEAREVHRKAVALDRSRSELINIASHELLTPLTIINSFTMIMSDKLGSLPLEEQAEYLGYIRSACDRFNRIFDQFRIVSEVQDNQARISQTRFPLDELLTEILDGLSPAISKRVIKKAVPERLVIQSDRHYLSIMLKHIVDNSLRYSPAGKPVILSVTDNQEEVEISVQDFGAGIRPSELPKMFDPFAQLHDVDKHASGIGLGLYIVRILARLLDIAIDVESASNQGTMIRFRLPRRPDHD